MNLKIEPSENPIHKVQIHHYTWKGLSLSAAMSGIILALLETIVIILSLINGQYFGMSDFLLFFPEAFFSGLAFGIITGAIIYAGFWLRSSASQRRFRLLVSFVIISLGIITLILGFWTITALLLIPLSG